MKALLQGAWLAAVLGAGVCTAGAQVNAPIPLAFSEDDNPCPAFGPGTPSASTSRCNTAQSARYLTDGGNHLFASLGSIGGYDSAFDARPNMASTLVGGVAYGGLLSLKPRSFNLVENSVSLVDYGRTNGTRMYLDSTTVSLTHTPSVRTILSLDANNIIGNDAVRVFSVEDSTAGTDSAIYGITTGLLWDNQVTARLSHDSTETRWWSIAVRNNYRNLLDEKEHVNTLHGRAEIHYQPWVVANLGLFEETAIEKGASNCTAQSVGVVYERRIENWLSLEASGAPAIGTRSCVDRVTANLYGALSAQPRRFTNLWVSARRSLNDSEFAWMTYENNAQAGWIERLGLDSWFKLRGGWVGGTVPARTQPFSGYFVSSSLGHRLSRQMSALVSFQHFNWSGVPNISPTRTIITASVFWSPSSHTPDDIHGPTAH